MDSVHQRPSTAATARRLTTIALALLAAGCGSLPGPGPEPSTVAAPEPLEEPVPTAGTGTFTVAASRIDTWNAIGQIVVSLEGASYLGRSQMLGLYAVGYRGEEFLIETEALVTSRDSDGIATRVSVILRDGQQAPSRAMVELLARLQQRLPAELARLASDEEYQKLLSPPGR